MSLIIVMMSLLLKVLLFLTDYLMYQNDIWINMLTGAYECRNLTREDSPENGATVCHERMLPIENHSFQAVYCDVTCNPGYEVMGRVNDYEYCGPSTGYKWSFQMRDPSATLDPCVRKYGRGIRHKTDTDFNNRGHQISANQPHFGFRGRQEVNSPINISCLSVLLLIDNCSTLAWLTTKPTPKFTHSKH